MSRKMYVVLNGSHHMETSKILLPSLLTCPQDFIPKLVLPRAR
jgi:hypothetical protein